MLDDSYGEDDVYPKVLISGNKYYSETPDGYELYKRIGSKYLFHNESGPAVYSCNQHGEHVEYFVSGNLHREDGPAIVDGV